MTLGCSRASATSRTRTPRRGPYVRVVKVPGRQLGMDAVVGAAQRFSARVTSMSSVGACRPTVRWTDTSEVASAACTRPPGR